MNKYKRTNTMMRVICFVLAAGMVLTAVMSMIMFLM